MDHQNMEKNTVVEAAVQVCNGPATGNGQDTHRHRTTTFIESQETPFLAQKLHNNELLRRRCVVSTFDRCHSYCLTFGYY